MRYEDVHHIPKEGEHVQIHNSRNRLYAAPCRPRRHTCLQINVVGRREIRAFSCCRKTRATHHRMARGRNSGAHRAADGKRLIMNYLHADDLTTDLIEALEPVISRVRTDITWRKDKQGIACQRNVPLSEERLREHLDGGAACGVCPIKKGKPQHKSAFSTSIPIKVKHHGRKCRG